MTKKLVSGLALALVIGVLLLVSTDQIGILRLGLVAAACLLLPGLGWALRSRLGDAGDRLALAIGISLCAVTVIAATMAVTGRWSAWIGLAALLAVALAGFLSKKVLNAIGTGLKWFINLFAGPESPTAPTTSR